MIAAPLLTMYIHTCKHTHTHIHSQGVGWANPDYIPLMIASTIIGNYDRSQGGGVNMANKLAKVSMAAVHTQCT